ncbi:MAG: oxidoreductase [Lentisphaerae bacterium RIFOXYB12_FULL_65_16]|nr:MAG: oxidoreductase [Lentisphaerae bacterium RIFOXYA12_64_32]OGV92712.1 MAG: oxidoreductase [Lentisphaerae bacterium RIFOXYB12_FULL_65_16]
MQGTICRWGILGTAEIARKNWLAIRNAPNCTLAAVASRDIARCRSFIDACQRQAPFEPPPHALGSYEELLACDAVDAVYIPLPTGVRKSWVIRAAEAGKHVLAEKPAGLTAQDVQDMLATCRQNGVQFMDGVMFMHSRRLERIRDVLADGQTVGALKRITAQFADGEASGDAFSGNIRARSNLEPHGCLGDLGWYCIRFILWALNGELPVRVAGHTLDEYRHPASPGPVPVDFSGELFFANGVSAGFYCSFSAQIQQWVSVGGTKGSLFVSDFVLPHNDDEIAFEASNPTFNIKGCDFVMEPHAQRFAVREHSHSATDAQETNMFRRFGELVLSGRPDDAWGQMTLKTQQVLDACLQSARSDGRPIDMPG